MNYFEKLKELRDTYYNRNSGDKFYTWEDKIMNEKRWMILLLKMLDIEVHVVI